MTADETATPVAPEPTSRRRGLSIRRALLLGVLLVLAFGGATAWAVTTNADLEATRQRLTSTQGDLTSTTATLTETEASLTEAVAELASEREKIESNGAKITVLEFQIDRKAACIEAQTANLAEFRRILALERENFARTTSGSAWAKAVAASDRALDLSVEYLKNAYTSAAAGNYSTANNWLSKSNAQIKVSNKQIDVWNREIKSMNAASDAINAANDALGVTLDKTTSTCGG